MNELDEIMNGKQEMRGFRIEGDTIGFDTQKHANWNLNPRDIENIIYTIQQELHQYKNNWGELKEHLEAMIRIYENEYKSVDDAEHYRSVLNKMKKLEEDK